MVHLGTQISALADGRLGLAGTERALGHVAACPECAAELAVTRAARAALADAMDVPVAGDLALRLLALSSAGGRWSSGDAGARWARAPRSWARPRWMRDLTVPSLIPRVTAISSYDRPSMSHSTTAARNSGGRASSAFCTS